MINLNGERYICSIINHRTGNTHPRMYFRMDARVSRLTLTYPFWDTIINAEEEVLRASEEFSYHLSAGLSLHRRAFAQSLK